MRNDSGRWDPSHPHPTTWACDGVTLTTVATPRLTLISGADILARTPDALGWPGPADGATYRLCLRRDRILEVGHAPRPDGWDAAVGQAVSDITAGSRILEIDGNHSLALLQRGAEIQRTLPSRSVARRLFGVDCMLYAHGQDDRFRLHVPVAMADAVWHALTQAAKTMG